MTARLAEMVNRTPAFVRFLACGGIAAAVNWSSRFLWSTFLPFGAAVLAAYATGMVVAFVLFRQFVFVQHGGETANQAVNFVIVNLVGMIATWAVALLMVHRVLPAIGLIDHVEAIGHGVAIFTPVITSWFGHRYLTFREAEGR